MEIVSGSKPDAWSNEQANDMRRNGKDIEADILRITTGGARKTQIVYRGNLNFKIVKNYLSRLIEQGFIKHEKGKGKYGSYHTTPLGHEFLRRYNDLYNITQMPPIWAV